MAQPNKHVKQPGTTTERYYQDERGHRLSDPELKLWDRQHLTRDARRRFEASRAESIRNLQLVARNSLRLALGAQHSMEWLRRADATQQIRHLDGLREVRIVDDCPVRRGQHRHVQSDEDPDQYLCLRDQQPNQKEGISA